MNLREQLERTTGRTAAAGRAAAPSASSRLLASLVAIFLAVLVGVQPAYRDAHAVPVLILAAATAALVVRPIGRRDQSYLWMLAIAVATMLAPVATGLADGAGRDAILEKARDGMYHARIDYPTPAAGVEAITG